MNLKDSMYTLQTECSSSMTKLHLTNGDTWSLNPTRQIKDQRNAKDFIKKSQWIRGPEFLWQTEDHWPRQGSYENEIQGSSPEVKKVTTNTTVIEVYGSMLSRFERFSNWQGLKTAVALCMEYKWHLRMSIRTSDEKTPVDESP